MPPKVKPLSERLYSRCVADPNGCVLWTGVTANGYGIIGRGMRGGGIMYTHRASYELANGPIPDGLQVCHTCDVKTCVNPKHMFLGTHYDNKHDSIRKGRSDTRGKGNAMAKLTESQVLTIRNSTKKSSELAVEMGVGVGCIRKIKSGTRWRHLPKEA